MIQKNLLRILFVEDVPSDVDLAVLELRKEKITFDFITVCTKPDLENALRDFNPDLIISDYMMPAFNGLQALKIAKQFDPDMPFILYTGSVNEETAVECLKAGAQDYVIKEHMTRLPFAVKEALDQVRINKEKRVSELLLKDNEEKLQSIFSAAPVGIGLIVNKVIIEINDTFCDMTGFSRKDLIGKSTEVIFSDNHDHTSPRKEEYLQILENGTGSVETMIKCKDGHILNVIVSSTPLDKKDLSKGITFTVLDITERKRSEEALRESQQLFETLSKVSPVGIFRTRPDGYTTYVNPEWVELAGIPFEEAIGFGWLRAVHPDDRKDLEEVWTTDVKQMITSIAEYRFLRSDGSIVWVMGNAVPEWKNNSVAGYIGTITDITKHKNNEIALRKSEEKYRGIFENVQDVYYEILNTGKILEVSPSIKILSHGQYEMGDLIGKSIFDYYADLNQRQAILSELQSKGKITDFEVELINKDGSIIPCSVSAKLILNKDGLPEKVIGSMHDITDRTNATAALKMAKEKAERSDKLKTDFLNNISHEVRTPLNGILGFAEIISLHDLSEEEKKDSLTMLFESSNRLLSTITNYMDISLITSGSLSINKKDFNPSQILNRILNNFEPVCSSRQLEIKLELPENSEDYLIHSDPEICQKIISHFMDNAVKFTENGSITFGFKIKTDQAEFFVRDTGIGIGPESYSTIFDRFSKEYLGPYKVTEGSGLGLSIAKGMSEAIGGSIWLESETGTGSCFFLSIPLKQSSNRFDQKFKEPGIKSPLSQFPILVAEDEETNFYYLNALLARETGAKILHATNGREAIEIFKANPDIKLILMDIKMPEIDGFEATRQIKMINKDVRIIAITAYAMSGDEERIIASGCDGYLSKPINKKSLLEKISEFVKIR